MSDQATSGFSHEKASRSYMISALILAALIAAAGFIHFTLAAKEKTLSTTAAAAQHEFAMTQRVALLTAEFQVTHDEALISTLKEAATTALAEHEEVSPYVLSALSHGLADQAGMEAGTADKKVRGLVNLAFAFAGNPDGAEAKEDAQGVADFALKDVADSWQSAVNGYIAQAQKEIDLLSKIGLGLYAAMLALVFYQMTSLVAPAMAHIKAQRDHLEHMGSTDMLTGFYNRAMLFKVVSTLISGAKRHKQPLAVLAVDIDDFKMINDKYGRAAGDAAIKKVGLALNEVLRTSDVMGRVGGQEFGVFLPSTDEYRATFVAEKLRAAIENLQFSIKDAVVLLRVSIGVADLQPNHKSTDDMLRAAEAALQIAKDAGRNKVATAAGLASPAAAPASPPTEPVTGQT